MSLAERLDNIENTQKDHQNRLEFLEGLMARVLKAQERTEEELARLSREMREFKDEMRAFKDEMKDFKDEMKEFKDEMKDFKDEMKEFKDEMKEFKDEMRDFKDEMKEFKDEMRLSIKELNKKWGALANKMGTLAEDIIAPGLPYALRRTFGLEIKDMSVRRRRKLNGDEQEFDIIAVANGFVFLVDVKSVYRPQYLEEF